MDGLQDEPLEELQQAVLVIATGKLSDRAGAALARWVEEGNTALLAPVDREAAVSQARAFGQTEWFREEVVPPEYAMLGSIDFQHPLFEPFADARFSDFTKIHFWQYRRIAPEAFDQVHVVARFDGGDPLLADATMGRGRLFLLASGWHPADSQLAVSSKFVPLLFRLLEVAGGVPAAAEPKRVGDVLAVVEDGEPNGAGYRVVKPNGSEWVGSTEGSSRLVAEQPGLYQVTAGDYSTPVAVNLEPAESRTGPLDSDQLASLGVPLAQSKERLEIEQRRQAHLSFSELEKRQKLWRWFLLATLTLVLVETGLGGLKARRAGKAEA
jgi:hypothetical protein